MNEDVLPPVLVEINLHDGDLMPRVHERGRYERFTISMMVDYRMLDDEPMREMIAQSVAKRLTKRLTDEIRDWSDEE